MEQIENMNISGEYDPYMLSWEEEIMFPSTRKLSEYGNRIYNRYPARSVFLVPRAILAKHQGKYINVLDPFMGSGTTAVETIISGNRAYGTEMDPFARIVAEVSTRVFTEEELKELEKCYKIIQSKWTEFSPLDEPNLTGIERWFKENDLPDLLRLRNCIESIAPEKFKAFMLIVFADCIKPVSKMERQSTKPYISSKYEKKTKSVDESFAYSFKAHFASIKEMSEKVGYNSSEVITWLGNDATSFKVDTPCIDLAITSPPYINAFDYTQCIKVESALCGLLDNNKVRELKSLQVGQPTRRKNDIAENVKKIFEEYYLAIHKIDKESADTCLSYFNDICSNLMCVYDALRTGGEYHMIIGDSKIKEVDVPTHNIIGKIATEIIGYEWFGCYKYVIKDHRTSIPRDKPTSKIKYEYVIMLRK